MTRLLVLVLAALTLAPLAAAAVPVAPYDTDLAIQARWGLDSAAFRGEPMAETTYVRCYRSDGLYDAAFRWRLAEDPFSFIAYYSPGSHTAYLRPSTCSNAHRFIRRLFKAYKGDRGLSLSHASREEVGAYITLLHEALHRQGIRNERVATCYAVEAVRDRAKSLGATNLIAKDLAALGYGFIKRSVNPNYRVYPTACYRFTLETSWSEYAQRYGVHH